MKRKHARRVNAVTGTVVRASISLVFYAFVIVFVLKAARMGFQFGYDVFNGTALTAEKGEVVEYTIEEGASIRKIAADLEELGLIENQYVMIVQKVFYNINYKPGTFELDSSMTSKEMLEWMTMISHSVVEETEAPEETVTETEGSTEATTADESATATEGGEA